eukprot:10938582-Ditylum_brightwellii.AAC.1
MVAPVIISVRHAGDIVGGGDDSTYIDRYNTYLGACDTYNAVDDGIWKPKGKGNRNENVDEVDTMISEPKTKAKARFARER